jgi:hypothetical protein
VARVSRAKEKRSLSFRLPRENPRLCAPYNDEPDLVEQAMSKLGKRAQVTKMGFLLDGKPVNTDKLLAAAGLKFADA